MKMIVWHNIMWSRYKGSVFSALHTICDQHHTQLQVIQIAETANERAVLSPVDTSYHKYSYELLFKGAYERVPRLRLFWRVAKKAWSDDADVTILAGYDRPEYWIQAAVLLMRNKCFACFCDSTAYDNKQRFFRGLLKRLFFAACSAIYCYGERAAQYVTLYGVSEKKIIRRCQAAALYEGYTPELALRRRLELYDAKSPPRFLYVGRFSDEKSIDHLILAFDRFRKNFPLAKLILVGGGPNESSLRKLSHELRLDGAIEFAGPKHEGDLYLEYFTATCLVLPSYREPWGLVVNEAFGHGCPAIVSNRCGCVPELVADGNAGCAFVWGNIDDLYRKMLAIAELDPSALSKRCFDQISPYTAERAARSILEGSAVLARKATQLS